MAGDTLVEGNWVQGTHSSMDSNATNRTSVHHKISSLSKKELGQATVLYDFKAEMPDELGAKAGEAVIVVGQINSEWFIAERINRLGGPGLIPVSYLKMPEMPAARNMIPTLTEWKKQKDNRAYLQNDLDEFLPKSFHSLHPSYILPTPFARTGESEETLVSGDKIQSNRGKATALDAAVSSQNSDEAEELLTNTEKRRKGQNRAAQHAFRKRMKSRLADLEAKRNDLMVSYSNHLVEKERLREPLIENERSRKELAVNCSTTLPEHLWRQEETQWTLNHDWIARGTSHEGLHPAFQVPSKSIIDAEYSPFPDEYSQVSANQNNINERRSDLNSPSLRTSKYVRALYDYKDDDPENLIFWEGEVIEVLTELNSGWVDGMIGWRRGWFPRNYCTEVREPNANKERAQQGFTEPVELGKATTEPNIRASSIYMDSRDEVTPSSTELLNNEDSKNYLENKDTLDSWSLPSVTVDRDLFPLGAFTTPDSWISTPRARSVVESSLDYGMIEGLAYPHETIHQTSLQGQGWFDTIVQSSRPFVASSVAANFETNFPDFTSYKVAYQTPLLQMTYDGSRPKITRGLGFLANELRIIERLQQHLQQRKNLLLVTEYHHVKGDIDKRALRVAFSPEMSSLAILLLVILHSAVKKSFQSKGAKFRQRIHRQGQGLGMDGLAMKKSLPSHLRNKYKQDDVFFDDSNVKDLYQDQQMDMMLLSMREQHESRSQLEEKASSSSSPGNLLKARKRTKTGCLTCRKRRINCGEERPVCINCVKSKRGCEGYTPHLTFKNPAGSIFKTKSITKVHISRFIPEYKVDVSQAKLITGFEDLRDAHNIIEPTADPVMTTKAQDLPYLPIERSLTNISALPIRPPFLIEPALAVKIPLRPRAKKQLKETLNLNQFYTRIQQMKRACEAYFRPRLQPGYRRLEWICDCGEELYGDFDDTYPESVNELADMLQHPSCDMNSGSQQSRSTDLSTTASAQTLSNGTTTQHTSAGSDATKYPVCESSLNTLASDSSLVPPKKYLELCVNTGEFLKTLGEIEISQVRSDGLLFREIKKKYLSLRGYRIKHFLLTPVAVQFVQFSLEERHIVGILDFPFCLPPESEVASLRYDYNPCPLKPPPIPSHIFLHHMYSSRDHPRSLWLDRLPKKLKESIMNSTEALPIGWGIHIVEGPNRRVIFWIAVAITGLSVLVSTIWAVVRADISGAFGIGAYIVSVPTLLVTAFFLRWSVE